MFVRGGGEKKTFLFLNEVHSNSNFSIGNFEEEEDVKKRKKKKKWKEKRTISTRA